MSILDTLGEMMSESTTTKLDIERLSRIKKMLNLKESESIKSVPTSKIVKFMECYGKMATEGIKRYAQLTEDVDEKKRIAAALALLGVK